MTDIVLAITGIIFGAIISYLISRYFFKQGIKKKELTPYLHFATKIFSSIEPELRRNLKINYKNLEIDNLYQLQFVIANTGDKPIRDFIKPLTLEIPKKYELLDIETIHIHPDGRELNAHVANQPEHTEIIFNFPLLDIGEYFVIKLLAKFEEEKTQKEDKKELGITSLLKFKLTLDELPPELKIQRLPFNHTEEKPKKFEWSILVGLFVILLVSTSLISTLYRYSIIDPNLYLFNFKLFFKNFSWYSLGILICWLLALVQVVVVLLLLIVLKDEIKPDKKQKFILPKKILRHRRRDFWFE